MSEPYVAKASTRLADGWGRSSETSHGPYKVRPDLLVGPVAPDATMTVTSGANVSGVVATAKARYAELLDAMAAAA